VVTSLEEAQRALLAGELARVCSHVPGADSGCDRCRGHGWLPTGLREIPPGQAS
jgi:hypothetical protein